MLITPRFKKSLIVEQFQGNYLITELKQTNKQTNIKRGLSPKANFHDIEMQLCCCYTES